MSKIFFDHLVEVDYIKIHIDRISRDHNEKEDLWNLVDEFINHKVISSVLTKLPEKDHEEFLSKFIDKPYDTDIIGFLDSKIPQSFTDLIAQTLEEIKSDLNTILDLDQKRKTSEISLKKKKK